MNAISDLLPRQRRLGRAYRELFDGPTGELVLNDLLREAGMLDDGFVPGEPDTSAFNAGKRSVALHILEKLRWTETALLALSQARTDETIFEAAQ